MKICKKCKKKLSNKTKICNCCGADVSKCKIIKNNSQVSKKEKNVVSVKNEELKKSKQNDILNFEEKKVSDDRKQKEKEKKVKELKKTKIKKNKKIRISLCKKLLIALLKAKKSLIIKFSNMKTFFIKKCNKKDYNQIKEKKNKKIRKNNFLNKIKIKFKLLRTKIRKDNKDKKEIKIKTKIDKKIVKQEYKKYKKQEKQKTDDKDKINKIKSLIKNSKLLYFVRKKKVKISFVIIIVLGLVSYLGFQTYNNFFGSENTIIVGEEATNNKLFAQGDIITYKGVNYQVLGVETSVGNSYKSPEEGNIFLIVTIQIENNTGDKIEYSYKNWTMSNSLEEENKRIFTSINVDTALYSGELVIGGIKRGSIVFEQPKNDKKLKLNFYDLKEMEDGKKDIDKDKKIFSVSIKIPEELKNTSKAIVKE